MTCDYVQQTLCVDNISLTTIAAEYGTPTYVYSAATISDNYLRYERAFGARNHEICYAVKANSNLAVLDILASLGAGFDVVSVGELERVNLAGGAMNRTVFAGVGKMPAEIERALELGIACFNIESVAELELINALAQRVGLVAPVAVRVNPDVDPKTHPYISTGLNENKFGVPMTDALSVYQMATGMAGIRVVGVACHIGSQITEVSPFVDAAKRVAILLTALSDAGIAIEHVDIGGGLGISYGSESPPMVEHYIEALCQVLDPKYRIVVEPGRSIVGDAGLLLTRVQYMKQTPTKTFAIVDASMTELIRPALYQAVHPIREVVLRNELPELQVDVVGPVCETADFLGKNRHLRIQSDDLLAIEYAGAYGAVMASSYNTRPKPAEVLTSQGKAHLIRERDTIESLMANERIPKR